MKLSIPDIQKLPENVSQFFTEKPELFESFLRFHKNKINRTGFVFQIQPFDIRFPCFVCHIVPSTTGKANQEIICKLHLIKKLSKKHRICIKSYAFDGDNCYNNLHSQYYGSFINNLINKLNIRIIKKSKIIKVVCDPPHLLKRLRYRLFSNFIHSGFDEDFAFLVDIREIRKILDFIPNIVFDNNKLTKMNDCLPLLLFSPLSFIKLLESKNYSAISYWFPAVCMIIAMTDKELSFQWQLFFLECSLWFLIFYKESENKSNPTKPLRLKKNGENKNVRFYTEELLIQFTNSIYSNIQFMLLYRQNFCFDRNSSTPLEHTFGLGRIRCKDINTITRFAKSITDIENYSKKCKDFNDKQKVHCRRSSFGINVSEIDDDLLDIFSVNDFAPQEIASSILKQAGFTINHDAKKECLEWFFKVMSVLQNDFESPISKKEATSNSLFMGTRGNIRSNFLIKSQPKFVPPSTIKDKKNH